MIAYPVLLGVAGLGLSLAGSGIGMLLARRARICAVLLVLAGVGLLVGTLLDASDRPEAADVVLPAAVTVFLALAVTTYPRPSWRHPVDLVALVAVAATGALAAARPTQGSLDQPMGMVLGVVLVAHTWWRIERADGSTRRALLWLALVGGVAGLVSGFVVFLVPPVAAGVVLAALWAMLGPAMYVGVARPEVVDVRGLVVQVVVFVVAVIAYLALFVAVASLLEILVRGAPGVGALALVGALAAVFFNPLQVVLRGVVDELLFGARPDPLDAATQVANQIGDDPESALRAIREALVLPYASLHVDGVPVATSGVEVTHTRTLPLGENTSAALIVGLRPGDLTLGRGDQHVLRLVTPLLAQTLRVRALAANLQESRGQTITALEEERRRLRRDLHDGLGPRLSGIAFTSDAILNTLRSDPAAAEELLRVLRTETASAIAEIRELVYAMRPPALDELGLVTALRQQAVTIRTADGSALRVRISAPELPALPAAVEVAAYRIVVEALTNVARHSGGTAADVRIAPGAGSLVLEVQDNGRTQASWVAGVGLASMRERAGELGGSLEAGRTPSGGRVRAVLPLG